MPKRNETLKFSAAFQGTARTSAQTTIVDTSYPMRYSVRWSSNASGTDTITQINEGSTPYFVVETDNVPDGTVIQVLTNAMAMGINGAVVADFTNFIYKQPITINNGFGSVGIPILADNLTEGKENFYCAALDEMGTVLGYAYIDILDTSLTPVPSYSLDWRATATTTSTITNINEGSTAWLNVGGTNIPNGTVVTVKLSGTVNSADFTDNIIQKDIIIQNNTGRTSFTLANDLTTEGTETLIATAYVSGTSKATATITVNDTSAIEDIIITGPKYDSDTFEGEAYTIIEGINLYDYYVSYTGKAPSAGSKVRFVLQENWSLVGRWPHQQAMIIDERWNNVGAISLLNRGIIVGRGAVNGTTSSKGAPGFTAILNTSNKNLDVDNYRIIAGGGGGAAGQGGSRYALPGAPYGSKGARYSEDSNESWSSAYPQKPPKGEWGEIGTNNGSRAAGQPGYVSEGLVTITNIGTKAWWKGREGRLGIA